LCCACHRAGNSSNSLHPSIHSAKNGQFFRISHHCNKTPELHNNFNENASNQALYSFTGTFAVSKKQFTGAVIQFKFEVRCGEEALKINIGQDIRLRTFINHLRWYKYQLRY
jgi:hypothetical protein